MLIKITISLFLLLFFNHRLPLFHLFPTTDTLFFPSSLPAVIAGSMTTRNRLIRHNYLFLATINTAIFFLHIDIRHQIEQIFKRPIRKRIQRRHHILEKELVCPVHCLPCYALELQLPPLFTIDQAHFYF